MFNNRQLSCDMKKSFLLVFNRQNGFKFLQIIAIYIVLNHDFFQKIEHLVWELQAFTKKNRCQFIGP